MFAARIARARDRQHLPTRQHVDTRLPDVYTLRIIKLNLLSKIRLRVDWGSNCLQFQPDLYQEAYPLWRPQVLPHLNPRR